MLPRDVVCSAAAISCIVAAMRKDSLESTPLVLTIIVAVECGQKLLDMEGEPKRLGSFLVSMVWLAVSLLAPLQQSFWWSAVPIVSTVIWLVYYCWPPSPPLPEIITV